MRRGLAASVGSCQSPHMRIQIFVNGAMMLALGFYGMTLLDRMAALALLQGTLLLGGGIIYQFAPLAEGESAAAQ